MIGYIIFLFFVILIYFSRRISSKYLLIVLVLFSAIRFDVGWDYNMYVSIIRSACADYKVRELGDFWFNYFKIANLTGDVWLPISILSVVTNLLIYYSLKLLFLKNEQLIKISLLFYALYPDFYLSSFSTIRQWLAVALCFFVFCTYLKNKNTKSLFLLLFTVYLSSVYIHSSSIAFLGLIFLEIAYNSIRNLWVLLTGSVFVFFFIFYYVDNLVLAFFEEYQIYSDVDSKYGGKFIYIKACIGAFLLWGYKFVHTKKSVASFLCFVSVFAISFSTLIILVIESTIFNRIVLYFMIPILIPIGQIIYRLKKKHIHINIIYVLFMSALFLLYLNHVKDTDIAASKYVPYKTIWSEKNTYVQGLH